jgi:Protein of unknown function (DUF2628)
MIRLRSGPARLVCGFEAFSSVQETSKMSIYTVHAPPAKSGQSAPDPERFVFVRDGFSFWAFLLGPLWMLWHGLWLALAGYLVLAAALQFVLGAAGAQSGLAFAAGAFLALLVGFEAATLRRLPLARRRWKNVGIVVGDDLESAERRFFDAWVHGEQRAPAPPKSSLAKSVPPAGAPPASNVTGTAGPQIIGLFPQPGASR